MDPGRRSSWVLTAAVAMLCADAGMVHPPRTVARPALCLGGEWAGHVATYSATGQASQPGVEVLTSEAWVDRRIHRHSVQLHSEGPRSSRETLPPACCGSLTLAWGAAMLEPDTLNVRAWAVDAVDGSSSGLWRCEAVFDGLSGDRPHERDGAFECPKERTRVQCVFDPASGTLARSADIAVWQERCWSATPAQDDHLDAVGGLDPEWVRSVVGLECFGNDCVPGRAAAATGTDEADGGMLTTDLTLGCGVSLLGKPGLLELTLTSGTRARNGYHSIVVKRSWVTAAESGASSSSVFTEVEVVDDTTGEQ